MFIDLFHLLFPKRCISCKSIIYQQNSLCTFCLNDLPLTYFHILKTNSISDSLKQRVDIEAVWPMLFFTKESKVQSIIHHLKYYNYPRIGTEMGLYYAHFLENKFPKSTIICSVPLHPKRLKSRGYNQADFFGEGLAKGLNLKLMPILKRCVNTSTQTKLNKQDRWTNVSQAFSLNEIPPNISHIIIVDDVITTGATIEACSKLILNRLPHIKIYILTIAWAND